MISFIIAMNITELTDTLGLNSQVIWDITKSSQNYFMQNDEKGEKNILKCQKIERF